MRCFGLATAVILVCSVIAPLAHAEESGTITVRPGESLQAAIDSALEGGVVNLMEGEWEEHVTIDKNLTLRGEGADRTVIRAIDVHGDVVQIMTRDGRDPFEHAPSVTVIGLSVVGPYGWLVAIRVGMGVHATLSDCSLSACGIGISVDDGAVARITRCVISDHRPISDPEFIGDGEGIIICPTAQATIEACLISDNAGQGIVLWDAAEAVIFDCAITRNRFGIVVHGGALATIERNRIVENYHYGVCLFEQPCFVQQHIEVFSGHLTGKANTILGPTQSYGLPVGAVCPTGLSFLLTEDGGELDRRSSGDDS
jgi:nitrous oxidase accessory protein NosD